VAWQPPPDRHLPSSCITGLLAARDGTLWIGAMQRLDSWKGGNRLRDSAVAAFSGNFRKGHLTKL